MNNGRAVQTAISNGVRYLVTAQQAEGGFVSYSSSNPVDFDNSPERRTTFFPSLILQAVSDLEDPRLAKVKQKIVTFLLKQKSAHWSFNYWDQDSPEYTKQPYPDDLDDTFLALSALWRHDANLLDGAALAKVSQLLIATERAVGGPYRTWLAEADALPDWQDVDLAVNANIAGFLAHQGVELPHIVDLVESALAKNDVRSPYYSSALPIAYYIASWYKGAEKSRLRKLFRQPAIFENPLHVALSATSLLRLGVARQDLSAHIAFLLDTQSADGRWPAYAFCIDPSHALEKYFAASPALTTALCLEALYLYSQAPPVVRPKHATRYEAVIQSISKEVDSISLPDLRLQTKHILERIRKLDGDKQIILLPWVVREATGLHVSEQTLQQLACLSAWGWMAYTTYDDFLDGEGAPLSLPSANFALRRLARQTLQVLPEVFEFQQDATAILDDTDAANAWELANCRVEVKSKRATISTLPDYGDYWALAARSFGHALSGIGVLYAAGLGRNSRQMSALRQFFWHYLIARQLNDDAHDWQQDLVRGQLNAVATMVLGRYGHKHLKLTELQPLQELFWDHVIDDVAGAIAAHSTKARAAIAGSPDINAEVFEPLLAPLEASAKEALHKRGQTRDFIDSL